MKFVLIAVMAFMVSACAGGLPWGPQQHAGIETLEVTYGDGTVDTVVQSNMQETVFAQSPIKKVFWRSGKETNESSLVFELPGESNGFAVGYDEQAFENIIVECGLGENHFAKKLF